MPPQRSKRDPLIKWVEANARFYRYTLLLGFELSMQLKNGQNYLLVIISGFIAFQKHLIT